MTVLDRRFRLRSGEIDLIAEDGRSVVFVEVKTRRGSGFGRPADSVTAAKRKRMARVALAYLKGRSWLDRTTRFDVVEVYADREGVRRVRHIRDAFRLWPTG
jgi:putative endonuclease